MSATALDMLAGRISFIEGARILKDLWGHADLPCDDPDWQLLMLIDSETDRYPVGEVRNLWAPDALEKLQPRIDRAEAWAREVGAEACENIVRRLQDPANPAP
jgi:hypothetical protein